MLEAGEKIIIAAFKDSIEAGREEERNRRKDGSKQNDQDV